MKQLISKPFLILDYRGWLLVIFLILSTNVLTYQVWMYNRTHPPHVEATNNYAIPNGLYLMDQAAMYVRDVNQFERKVRQVADELNVPAEWLMAVMHSESRFDASVKNHKGSGATGLIQFMPTTAKDHAISTDKLRNLNHTEQMDYVFDYLNSKRKQYGDYRSLTDLYLAILYPKARSGDFCYTLYAKPSKAYQMNSGLDEDKDGRVTVSDIDRRMRRIYKTAYVAEK